MVLIGLRDCLNQKSVLHLKQFEVNKVVPFLVNNSPIQLQTLAASIQSSRCFALSFCRCKSIRIIIYIIPFHVTMETVYQ